MTTKGTTKTCTCTSGEDEDGRYIVFCPLHAAAPKMRELLTIVMNETISGNSPDPSTMSADDFQMAFESLCQVAERARALFAKVDAFSTPVKS